MLPLPVLIREERVRIAVIPCGELGAEIAGSVAAAAVDLWR